MNSSMASRVPPILLAAVSVFTLPRPPHIVHTSLPEPLQNLQVSTTVRGLPAHCQPLPLHLSHGTMNSSVYGFQTELLFSLTLRFQCSMIFTLPLPLQALQSTLSPFWTDIFPLPLHSPHVRLPLPPHAPQVFIL